MILDRYDDRSTTLGNVGSFVLRYSVLIIIVALVAIIWAAQARDDAALENYRNSAEGKAEAAREDVRRHNQLEIDLSQGFVRTRLRDPSSAQFLATRVVTRNGKEGVCGYVNAKNGFGGMAGNEAFAVIDHVVYLGNEHPSSSEKIRSFCGY